MMMLVVLLMLLIVGATFGYKFYKDNVKKDTVKEKTVATTQDNIPIDYIRDGIVKLKNGSYASIISIPSINIDLLEASEKEAILGQYRQILNAVNFSFQFLQQSRVIDISDYLKKIEVLERKEDNFFVKKQLDFYRNYLIELINTRSVLTKKFYIIVSYDEVIEKRKKMKGANSLLDIQTKKERQKEKEKSERESVLEEEKKFKVARKELQSRTTTITSLFARLNNIEPVILHDDEVIELFYTSYNKTRSVYQGLGKDIQQNFSNIYVKKQ